MACEIEAKVLAYSVGEDAPPLPTFQLRYPLQIHAELMTHRMFSRNARSSRAVPTPRMVEEVRNAPFVPRYWGANQKGMQASEECSEPVVYPWHPFVNTRDTGEPFVDFEIEEKSPEEAWLKARDYAVDMAQAFSSSGYHKQVANRLLAPFLHIDVVLTATELKNWFWLRDHSAAEPHIRDLAVAMREALEEYGDPQPLGWGDWHLPYVAGFETVEDGVTQYVAGRNHKFDWPELMAAARAVSVTRCAQVSYVPFHEAKLTIAEEIARHDQLISAQPMHASPAEHQATPDRRKPDGSWENPHLHGNLVGWIQYRKTLPGECA